MQSVIIVHCSDIKSLNVYIFGMSFEIPSHVS